MTQSAQHIVLGDLNAVTPRLLGRPDGRGDLNIPQQPGALLARPCARCNPP